MLSWRDARLNDKRHPEWPCDCVAAAECKAGSRKQANTALALLMGGLSADPPRLIKDLNINTDKPVSGNSQHAAAQD